MKELIEKYKGYLKYELNYSDYTIKEYIIHLDKYVAFLSIYHLNFKNINKDNVISFLKYLDEEKLSNRTISNILSSIRTFYNYLVDEEILENNIFKNIHNPKLEKKLPNFLSDEEMMKIIESIKTESILDYRNILIVELLYATGIRVSELVNIKVNDINFDDKSIKVLGKGKKDRIVFFGKYANVALNNYLKIRNSDNEYLFLNNNKNKISVRGIQKIIDNICNKACINNNVSPHTFRHTFATHLLNGGADIKSVQELLGHSSLDTTQIYTHITNNYLKSEYLKAMPRK